MSVDGWVDDEGEADGHKRVVSVLNEENCASAYAQTEDRAGSSLDQFAVVEIDVGIFSGVW